MSLGLREQYSKEETLVVKKIKHDSKRMNYRSWKRGKHWVYASIVLASIVGGVSLESTGVTSKVLSYIQKDFGTDVVEAISKIPSVLSRGEVLESDFYACVDDFTVPSTVGLDFANNATEDIQGDIRPFFDGATYVIPSDRNSNAIAVFNQPLDPRKDFSISAEMTVPDARIAAAGIYISDVPPEDIITKLGVGNLNAPGSSGALKVDSVAYTNHYMLFSGFHNTSGYAAILASGTDYTRITKGGSPSGKSKYMDDDYVPFGLTSKNRENVKIWATIDYNATTGIVTVAYQHNSDTDASGVGTYDKVSKSAMVQFAIDTSSPVYLGIVGNGDKVDKAGERTSRSTVTSVTGTYLTKVRDVYFTDDASNTLVAPSKVLMPLGGRLGIGNNDITTPYYYDKPNVPQGYTYLANQNPSVGGDRSVIVKYQRDVQTGFVERINKLTAQKLDPSQNVLIKGLTKENLSIKVPGYSGYYYINEITGDATKPTFANDGSTVDFKLKLDDTANGTNTTDSQEQVIQTYMNPSVQERILTITKPDGKVVTEKQNSTTDTDFPAISGQYAIRGYRTVIDGVPVNDVQGLQGIPGEPTDRTNNLKATIDSVPQKHKITYQAEPQKATIVYQDMTTGDTLKTDDIDGVADLLIPYETNSDIAKYIAQGYVVKSNNFTDGLETFDNDPSSDQSYLVQLVHDSENVIETKDISHKVTYTIKNGFVTAPKDYETKATITYNHFIDKVSGKVIESDFEKYALDGDVTLNPEGYKYESNCSEVKVEHDGKVSFVSPIIPDIQGYVTTVSKKTSILYSDAKPIEVLESHIIYTLDETINVTLPTDTFFYNITNDAMIKAATYTIINHSGLPVKISLDGFANKENNPKLPTDFALNLNITGNNVTGKNVITSSAKLIENGSINKSMDELFTLANCLDQYAATDTPIKSDSAINNIAKFTYSGSATALKTLKLGYTMRLKFEDVNF